MRRVVPYAIACLGVLPTPARAEPPAVPLPADPSPVAPRPATPQRPDLPLFKAPPKRIHGHARDLPPVELDDTAPGQTWSGKDLRERHLHLGEALDQQAGLRVQTLSGFGAPSQLSVRGSTAEQVAVFLDGVPVLSLDGSALDLGDLPLGQIERVELYRGMTPALLGTQAIGGALRIDLRQPKQSGGELSLGAGSYGARQVEGTGGWTRGGLKLSGGLRYLQADGDFAYRNDHGTAFDTTDDTTQHRKNNAVQRLGGTLGARLDLGTRWGLDARWLGAWLHQGVPGAALYEAVDADLDSQRHLGVLSLGGRTQAGHQLRLSAQVSRNGTEVDDRLGELGLPLHTRQTVGGEGLQATVQTIPWGIAALQARLAVQHGTVATRDLRKDVELPESSRTSVTAGMAVPLESHGLQLVPSVSAEAQQSQRFTNVGFPFTWRQVDGHDDRLWTARLGAGWRPLESVHVTAAATRGIRSPSLLELFGNGVVIVGNAALRPERATTYEAGLTIAGSQGPWRGALQTAAYTRIADDLVQLVTTSQHTAIFQNVARATLQGLEITAVGQAGPNLRLTAQHTTLVARDASGRSAYDGKPLPLRPRTRWDVRADWTQGLGDSLWQFGIWTHVQWQAGYFLDAANLVIVPSRTLTSAGARLSRGVWYVDARIEDALDTARVDLIGYPLPGRTFFATLGWRGWDTTAPSAPSGTSRPRGDSLEPTP
jgi:vitamin B12 transporter